jgi:hypothetical protein
VNLLPKFYIAECYLNYLALFKKREFDIAICGVLRTPQMAKNGKNRLAILTIFAFVELTLKKLLKELF